MNTLAHFNECAQRMDDLIAKVRDAAADQSGMFRRLAQLRGQYAAARCELDQAQMALIDDDTIENAIWSWASYRYRTLNQRAVVQERLLARLFEAQTDTISTQAT